MRFRIIVYLSLFLPGVLKVSAQDFDIIKTTLPNARLTTANTIFSKKYWHTDSVTAFKALDQLDAIAVKLNDTALRLDIYELKANYYAVNYKYNPRSLYYYDKAISESADYELPIKQGHYTFAKGFYCQGYKQYSLTCANYLKTYDIFKTAGFSHVPDITSYLRTISYFFYDLGDFELAKRFLFSALSTKPNHRYEIDMTNTIGLIWRSNNEYNKALLFFNKALNLAKKYNDPEWVGITTGNIGSVYFMQQDYDRALPFITTDYGQSLKYGDKYNAAIAMMRLAKIKIVKNDIPGARQSVTAIEKLIKPWQEYGVKQRIILYELKAAIFEKTGRLAEALVMRARYDAAKDTLAREIDILAIQRTKLQHETENNRLQVDRLNAEAKAAIIKRNTLAGGLFLLMIISILLYNRQKLIIKRDQAALQLEKAKVGQERDKARLALIEYTDKLRQQTDQIESFKAELEDIQEKASPTYGERLSQLEATLQAHIMTDRAWLEFKDLFDKVHPRFFAGINNRFQNLTESDLRHFALIKLRLSNREMANMLGITMEGIKKAKQRLRKKIGLTEEDDLEDTIGAI